MYPYTCLKFMHVLIYICVCFVIIYDTPRCCHLSFSKIKLEIKLLKQTCHSPFIYYKILDTGKREVFCFVRIALLFGIEEYYIWMVYNNSTELTNTIHWIEWECSLYRSCCMSVVHEKLYHMGYTFIHLPWQKHFLSF